MKKLKGIIIAVILSLASILMPFNVSAAVQSVIVPTFAGDTSSWSSHLSVTNFSDGTNNQASSTLSFTFDDDYYGYVYFDGYGPSNQHIANFATVFIAGGYGEYRYSYYQNGVINITSVTIQIVNVVKPDTTVDLTQIIQLLTAIESDTTAIDNVLDSTLIEIRSVLSQLIISNGYLEILTKIRQWNIPFESIPAVMYSMVNYDYYDIFSYEYFNYPVYKSISNSPIFQSLIDTNYDVVIIFMLDRNVWNGSRLLNFIDLNYIGNSANFTINSFDQLNIISTGSSNYTLLKCSINSDSATTLSVVAKEVFNYIPIYIGRSNNIRVSTDFALRFGLSNTLLDNINIIANGTTQSNSASSQLEQEASEYSEIADDVIGVEEGLTSNFETSVNQIDLNTGLNGFGGNFMTSATWVRTQFDRLTENTPYGSLVVYGLTLGFALLMLGKVFL